MEYSNQCQDIETKLKTLVSLVGYNTGCETGEVHTGDHYDFNITFSSRDSGVETARKFLNKMAVGGFVSPDAVSKIEPDCVNADAVNKSRYIKFRKEGDITKITFNPLSENTKALRNLDEAIQSAERDNPEITQLNKMWVKSFPSSTKSLSTSTEIVSNYLQKKIKAVFSRTIQVKYNNEQEFEAIIGNKPKIDPTKIDELIEELNDIFGSKGKAARLSKSDSDDSIGFRVIGDPIAMADCINKLHDKASLQQPQLTRRR